MPQLATLLTWLTATALVATVHAAGCSTKHPVLQPGETYVPAEGCQGVTFTNGQQCHCWSRCGWICVDGPPGSKWVADAGCKSGPTYDQGGYHCHCFAHNGYICDLLT